MNLFDELKLAIYECRTFDDDDREICLSALESCNDDEEFFETANDIMYLMEDTNNDKIHDAITNLKQENDKISKLKKESRTALRYMRNEPRYKNTEARRKTEISNMILNRDHAKIKRSLKKLRAQNNFQLDDEYDDDFPRMSHE